MSEYPADCCPLKCYIHFPCMAGDEDSPFWQGWAALRIKTFRLIENKYFETAVIAMILLSSLALVSRGEGRLVAEGGGGQGEGGGGHQSCAKTLPKKILAEVAGRIVPCLPAQIWPFLRERVRRKYISKFLLPFSFSYQKVSQIFSPKERLTGIFKDLKLP